jgi:hypothetical protein
MEVGREVLGIFASNSAGTVLGTRLGDATSAGWASHHEREHSEGDDCPPLTMSAANATGLPKRNSTFYEDCCRGSMRREDYPPQRACVGGQSVVPTSFWIRCTESTRAPGISGDERGSNPGIPASFGIVAGVITNLTAAYLATAVAG